jgi:hypothetical protein
MENTLQVERKAPILAASRSFGKYGRQPLHDTRAHKVEMNQAVQGMQMAWAMCGDLQLECSGKMYSKMLERLKLLQYSAKDIEDFSVVLAQFQGEMAFSNNAGLFLSALINNCKEEEFVIHTTPLDESITCIGYGNRKKIIVEGDAGDVVGQEMESGCIIVNGNAGYTAGHSMRGGSIIVNGDVDDTIGYDMSGGSIVVNGNAEDEVGHEMRGGDIIVTGDAGLRTGIMMHGGKVTVNGHAALFAGEGMMGGELHLDGTFSDFKELLASNVLRGKIFHNGELIVDK